jgi:translocation and assembly module TamB
VLTLRDGLLQDVSLPFPLEQVSVDVALHQDWANISGRFRLNDGDGTLQGKLRWQEQAPVWRMDATVATETITLPVLENSTAGVAARLVLGLEPGLIDVGGKILVDEADIRLVALPPESISTSPDSEMIGVSSRSAWRLNSDLEIDLGDDLRFRGFGVDMTLAGRLRLRNSRRYNNHITGEVNVQRGRFRAYGQDLTIRNGRVIFAGLANNPDLQLEAIRQSRDRNTIGGLRVTGTLQEPVGEFFAEPSMTDSDVAYFLLTGRRPPEPGQKDTTSGGALLNLGLARTNESAAKLASRLGIEGFQISTADGEQGLETHLSGYLSDDLFVSYGTGFEENTASLTLQYYITPHVVIEAVGGFTSALDIVYSFRVD